MSSLEHLRVKALHTMSKMVSECVDYANDHKRMIFEINIDYLCDLENLKCAQTLNFQLLVAIGMS